MKVPTDKQITDGVNAFFDRVAFYINVYGFDKDLAHFCAGDKTEEEYQRDRLMVGYN